MPRVILIEYNELCPPLLDRWMAAGYLPNFKKLYDRSSVFTTEADETGETVLEPWIQWYSIHTGLPYREHHVFHLTDGAQACHPDIWRILHERGKQVWNCGSMNCRGFAFPGSAFLPDPWSTTEQAYPPEIEKARRFISYNVQQHTNHESQPNWRIAAEFAGFMASHGLRPTTAIAILQQLASEFRGKRSVGWRRTTLLDKMQFDLFRYYYLRLLPDFSTFFVNSTAHLQHAYWRHMEPELFPIRPSSDEIDRYGNAIFYGYQEMDWLLGQFFALVGDEAQVVLATGFSQQAWPYDDDVSRGGTCYYRPKDLRSFLGTLGIAPQKVLPMMVPRHMLHFEDGAQVEAALEKLVALRCDGREVIGITPSEPRTITFANKIRYQVPDGSRVDLNDGSGRSFDFYELFYKVDEIRSTEHHPDGYLWIDTGKHERLSQKVSIMDILPTILGMYEIRDERLCGTDLLMHRDAPRARAE
jgi:hypothetical protein